MIPKINLEKMQDKKVDVKKSKPYVAAKDKKLLKMIPKIDVEKMKVLEEYMKKLKEKKNQ